jgi:two-component system sensor histidine kinase KdpD
MAADFSVHASRMNTPRRKAARVYAYLLLGILAPVAITLCGWPFRQVLIHSNTLLLYLLGVFFVALRFGLWPSLLASLTSAALFAYFFAPPIFSLEIADQENLVGLAVMMIVAAVTSNQAEKVRLQARLASYREGRASALYQLSKALAEARLENEIIEIGVRHIHNEFNSKNTLLFPDGSGRLQYPEKPPLAISLRGVDLALANRVFKHGQAAGEGAAKQTYLALKGSNGILGILVLESMYDHGPFLPEQRQLLDTFVNQIVHTLERASLAELAKEATLKMQSETLRNSLLSSISHDLRTPLATIVGASSTLAGDGENLSSQSRQNLIHAINEEALRMSELTTKILEMARLEAGEVVLNREWYEPEEIVGSALRRLDKKLKNRQVKVQISGGQNLIHVDAVLLQQVIVNLLDNAEKYSPADQTIDVTVETKPSEVFIKVADHGPGIPDLFQPKIFDKFFQINPESAQSGVGLGLSICRAIANAHGGEILVSRRQGGGSVFEIHLPFLESPPTIDPEEQRIPL